MMTSRLAIANIGAALTGVAVRVGGLGGAGERERFAGLRERG